MIHTTTIGYGTNKKRLICPEYYLSWPQWVDLYFYLQAYDIPLNHFKAYRIWFDTSHRLYEGRPVYFDEVCPKAAIAFFRQRRFNIRAHVTHIQELCYEEWRKGRRAVQLAELKTGLRLRVQVRVLPPQLSGGIK